MMYWMETFFHWLLRWNYRIMNCKSLKCQWIIKTSCCLICNICYLWREMIKLSICIGRPYLCCPTGANSTGVMQNHKHIKHARGKMLHSQKQSGSKKPTK